MTLPRVYTKLSYNVEIKRGLLCANNLSGSESVPNGRQNHAHCLQTILTRMAHIFGLKIATHRFASALNCNR